MSPLLSAPSGFFLASLALGLVPAPAGAGAAAPPSMEGPPAVELAAIAGAVDPAALRATVERLVAFGTRHTASDTRSPTRGIGAARRWVQARFAELGRDCGGCLDVITPAQVFTGERLPGPTPVMDVLAVQRGTDDPQRVVLITAHLDSRISDVRDATADAPGADDDASGVAAVLEAARVLSSRHFPASLVYGVLSGEEQGLYGGQVLAAEARRRGWQVEAALNNDIVGASRGEDGVVDNTHVRIFSEGTKATETPAQIRRRRLEGGEADAPARNLARYLAGLARRHLAHFQVEMVQRVDRLGRGGDQIPLLEAGFPAVRLTEAHEDYRHQHQDVRSQAGVAYGDTLEHLDFDYLAQVARLNAIGLAALAHAPAPPRGVRVSGAVAHDSTLDWEPQPGVAGWRAWWRTTTAAQWEHSLYTGAEAGPRAVLRDLVVDDWFFGVSAVSPEGWESPVVFPGEAGSF